MAARPPELPLGAVASGAAMEPGAGARHTPGPQAGRPGRLAASQGQGQRRKEVGRAPNTVSAPPTRPTLHGLLCL